MIEKFINLLNEVLLEVEKENNNNISYINDNTKNKLNSEWYISCLNDVVEVEIKQLLEYAHKGVVFFKYGKKQRMLESEYWILENIELQRAPLGRKISELQQLYNKM